MVDVFREVCRVLRDDGTLWLNLGDSYASDTKGSGGPSEKQLSNAGSRYETSQRFYHGCKPKDLVGIPWMVAFALRADGWYLRSDIIWHKPNPMPESVTDRCTKAHEYLFLLSKQPRYYYDANAIREENSETSQTGGVYVNEWKYAPLKSGAAKSAMRVGVPIPRNGRNRRSVWTVSTTPFPGAHFATFPPALIEPCILAGCPRGGVVLDPFSGAGTVAVVSSKNGRRSIGIELNPEYVEMAANRLRYGTVDEAEVRAGKMQHSLLEEDPCADS